MYNFKAQPMKPKDTAQYLGELLVDGLDHLPGGGRWLRSVMLHVILLGRLLEVGPLLLHTLLSTTVPVMPVPVPVAVAFVPVAAVAFVPETKATI